MQREHASTIGSSPTADTPVGGVQPVNGATGEISEASHEDPSGQNGNTKSANRSWTQRDMTRFVTEPSGSASTTHPRRFTRAPIDLTKRSDVLAVDKQLAQYFKKASAMNWPLFLVLLSSTFCDEKRRHILIFRVSSSISLVLNLVPLFLAGWMDEKEKPSSKRVGEEDHDDERVEPSDRYRILGLSFAAYLSNFSLTVTAISFAMLLRAGYAWFFIMLVGLIVPYCFVIHHGLKHGIAWGLAQYVEHRSDMDFFFGLCFEITQTNFTALSATLFGYLKTGQCMDVEFRAPEIILLVAIIIGLFVITMCTVPPAAGLPGHRNFLVQVMKFTIYGLLVLTSIGLFLAVLKISGPYVCLSIIVALADVVLYFIDFLRSSTIVACFKGFARCLQQNESPGEFEMQEALATSSEAENTSSQETSQAAPARRADEQSLLLVSFYSIMSGALMVSYSLNIRDQRREYKISLITMYSAILAYLGMVIITREATKGKIIAVWMSSIIAAVLLIAALVCVIIFVLSNPIKIGSSST